MQLQAREGAEGKAKAVRERIGSVRAARQLAMTPGVKSSPIVNIQLYSECTNHAGNRLELQVRPQLVTNQELARAYNLNRHTVAKWRQHEGTEDASHLPATAPYNPQYGSSVA